MSGLESLKVDVDEGRITPERLLDLIASQQRQLQAAQQDLQKAQQDLQSAKQRIEELEKQLGSAATAKVDEPYSMRAEEKRQEARGKKKPNSKPKRRRGRLKTADKIAMAERTESVFPDGVPPSEC